MTAPTLNETPLLAQITRDPLLIDQSAANLFRSTVQFLAKHELSQQPVDLASDDFWPTDPNDWMNHYRPYVVKDGILQVPVYGVLMHNFPYQVGSWATGYAYIEKAIVRGISDPAVRGIAMIVNSPGGVAAGCFELSDKIYGWRREKPIRAYAADHAYSAAYALASAASSITVTRSGGTGSVGVVTAHVDYSAALDQAGIKVTFIFAGKHKVEGNAYEELSDEAKGRIQARIDKRYSVFTSTVARNRDMDEDAVRKTEALCYDAEDSVQVGFADKIGVMEEEVAAFAGDIDDTTENDEMTTQTTDALDAAAQAAAVATARTEAATAERARIRAITESPEGKDRPGAALRMALNEKLIALDAAAVVEMLAEMPKEKGEAAPAPEDKPKGTATSPFTKAMDGTANPGVGADVGGDDDDDQSEAAGILAASRATTGLKPRKTKN